jgi:hypothetical protein
LRVPAGPAGIPPFGFNRIHAGVLMRSPDPSVAADQPTAKATSGKRR